MMASGPCRDPRRRCRGFLLVMGTDERRAIAALEALRRASWTTALGRRGRPAKQNRMAALGALPPLAAAQSKVGWLI
jgi:hypothetical protein